MALGDAGWIRPAVVRDMYDQMTGRLGSGPLAYGAQAYPLWIIGGTELWFRSAFANSYNHGHDHTSIVEG
jgi:hypothetical protein